MIKTTGPHLTFKKERVYIYNAHWSTFGGGEKYVCVLAEVLSTVPGMEVSLLIDEPSLSLRTLSSFYNISFDNVTILRVKRRDVARTLTDADLGIVLSNFMPYGLGAKRNIYLFQIPFASIGFFPMLAKAAGGNVVGALKDILRLRLIRQGCRADCAIVNSSFTQYFLAKHHGMETQVLHPPIDDFEQRDIPKERVILSVGRFFRGAYNEKRYDILIDAFKELSKRLPNTTWQYRLVGSCGDDDASREYLRELQDAAAGLPIYFHVNSPYEDLRRHYNEATLFWHAAGFGVDEARQPEKAEHFGMSTLEAMSTRCVPIVINRGGQKEIVSQGESGYLWNTVDELVEHSLALMKDPALLKTMQEGARTRFTHFNREQFARKLLEIMSV